MDSHGIDCNYLHELDQKIVKEKMVLLKVTHKSAELESSTF